MASAEILLQLFIVFVAAKVAGELFTRLDAPAVIGELLVGVLIGPHVLGLVGHPGPGLIGASHGVETATEVLHGVLDVVAELGVIILLFVVGLETRVHDILRVGNRAASVALGGVLLPLALGIALGFGVGETPLTALFLGTALVATSIGITARVLTDLGQLRTSAARVILGAAVIDDILGMILLAVAVGLAVGGTLSAVSIGFIAVQALAFTVFVGLVGTSAIRQYSAHLDALRLRNAPLIVALAVCLGLAVLAGIIGLAAIIGAFLAGMVFAEAKESHELDRQAQPIYDFLVPFFFVVTGTRVDPALFLDGSILLFATALTVLAVVGKLVGCGLGAIGTGWRNTAIVAVGMVPRGEVGLIVAGIGRSTGAISDAAFSVVVIMSVVTTLIVPPALKLLLTFASRRNGVPTREPALQDHRPPRP